MGWGWGWGVQTDTAERPRERETGTYRNNQTGLRDLKAQERHPQTHGGVAVGPSFPWDHTKDSSAPIVEFKWPGILTQGVTPRNRPPATKHRPQGAPRSSQGSSEKPGRAQQGLSPPSKEGEEGSSSMGQGQMWEERMCLQLCGTAPSRHPREQEGKGWSAGVPAKSVGSSHLASAACPNHAPCLMLDAGSLLLCLLRLSPGPPHRVRCLGSPPSGSHASPFVCVFPQPSPSCLSICPWLSSHLHPPLFPSVSLPPPSPSPSPSFSGASPLAPLLLSLPSHPLVLPSHLPLLSLFLPATHLPPYSLRFPPFPLWSFWSPLFQSVFLWVFFPVSFCVPPFLSVCLSIYHLPLVFLSASVLFPLLTSSGSPLWASCRPRSRLPWGRARLAPGSPLPPAFRRGAGDGGGPSAGLRAFFLPPALTLPPPTGLQPTPPHAAAPPGSGSLAPPGLRGGAPRAGRRSYFAKRQGGARGRAGCGPPDGAGLGARPGPCRRRRAPAAHRLRAYLGARCPPPAARARPGRAAHTSASARPPRPCSLRAGPCVRACGARGPRRPAARRALVAAGSAANARAHSLRAGAADELTAARSLARCCRGQGSVRGRPMGAGPQPAGGGEGRGGAGRGGVGPGIWRRPLPSGRAAGGG